jgi:hypothetical protein
MSATLCAPVTDGNRVVPQQRHRVDAPEARLWELQMELALQRVNAVLDFARNWSVLRLAKGYEFERAKCVFHLEWIFDNQADGPFTFRELCRFSESENLQDVNLARERIRAAFCLDAARDMEVPVPHKLRKRVISDWLHSSLSLGADSCHAERAA